MPKVLPQRYAPQVNGPSVGRTEVETKMRPRTSHGNAGVWNAWKAIKPAFHPSHTPWKSLKRFPHYHGYGDDYHVSEDWQSLPKTRNQSHSYRKGLVNHVSGLKRKGCPGILTSPLVRSSSMMFDPWALRQCSESGWRGLSAKCIPDEPCTDAARVVRNGSSGSLSVLAAQSRSWVASFRYRCGSFS
jgi:hypothetical protein